MDEDPERPDTVVLKAPDGCVREMDLEDIVPYVVGVRILACHFEDEEDTPEAERTISESAPD